jgi:hypothetical protein
MRTTLRLDDSLLDAAREHARERGETLTAVFERALRVYLARASSPEPVDAPPSRPSAAGASSRALIWKTPRPSKTECATNDPP